MGSNPLEKAGSLPTLMKTSIPKFVRQGIKKKEKRPQWSGLYFDTEEKARLITPSKAFFVTGFIKHRMCPDFFLKACSVLFEDLIGAMKCINKPKNGNMF